LFVALGLCWRQTPARAEIQLSLAGPVLRRVALASGAGVLAQGMCDHATLFIQIAAEDEKFRRRARSRRNGIW